MVGVVVAVEAVAADLDEVVEAVEPGADHRDALAVFGVVHRVGLVDPHREAELYAGGFGEPELLDLARGQRDKVVVGHVPELVALEAEVLHPDRRVAVVGDHPRTP